MSTTTQLRYAPLVVGAGQTILIPGDNVGGFLCTTAGTLSISAISDLGVSTVIVNALTCAVGWVDIPFYLGKNGGSVTSGTAAGTLAT